MNSANLLDRVLSKIVKRGALLVTHADGRAATFGEKADGYPDIGIRFADDKVARDIMLDPRLGAGEAFMDGRLLIESGDVMGLVQLLRANKPWERGDSLLKPSPVRRIIGHFSAARESINRQKSARANVAHHYDIGNDLYHLMLDAEHMQYSCAYWEADTASLGDAQTAKLAHIAAKLALAPGQHVLDIGCGWGGMAIYLANNFDVSVTGITLSEEQLSLARARAKEAGVDDRVKFELVDYRDMAARGDQFDRIVSVGMFEHVGPPQFEVFFSAITQLLSADGVMLLHTIGRMGSPGSTDAFTRKYIFPGGYIPALSETVAASEKFRLIATDVETLRLHYARTLRAWYANCMENQAAIEELHDERFFRLWTFYLAGATAAFESGGMCNYQIQYVRSRETLPITRDYLAEAERDLKSAKR
ncbi:cyclopropane-fatty-acyl-phospholipid synthase family protein [Altererythrobacter sp. ZODW24]|uniref:SAM-dependent methyltransferase n=1 Tax=Altererythrobacter sp. ZODW24 TaxID=2185142 RepID=UPI000DF73FAD|nr:cyclopropane-fatty-acyl-phospholipid synthase family protein [Altererythrobacter sp. ZODW24]